MYIYEALSGIAPKTTNTVNQPKITSGQCTRSEANYGLPPIT